MKFALMMFVSCLSILSCGEKEVGCQDDGDCRFGRVCIQNSCIGKVESNEGDNNSKALTQRPTGSNNNPICRDYFDCPSDMVCHIGSNASISCRYIEDAVVSQIDTTADRCSIAWEWNGEGRATYNCEPIGPTRSECVCTSTVDGARKTTFIVERSSACTDPVEVENNMNLFCRTALRDTLDEGP